MKKKTDLSISMLIEKDVKSMDKRVIKSADITLPLKSNLNLDERKIYHWVSDETVTSCYKCDSYFSFTNRKHHCRNCGKIFCGFCSNNWTTIPDYIETVPKKSSYWDYIYDEQRVCDKCFAKIEEIKRFR